MAEFHECKSGIQEENLGVFVDQSGDEGGKINSLGARQNPPPPWICICKLLEQSMKSML
jgi:hypothetical protein